ncbi:MAG: putative aminohydrolase SsnA [Clostridiales bacterium]|nr:putative aminohydrolase SsnA [Clostridiales bacterium]
MYLIGNGRVVSFDPERPFIENGAVLTDGELIAKVGETEALLNECRDAEFIDASGGLIMPGFINAHTHFYSALLRGAPAMGPSPASLIGSLRQRSWKEDRLLTFYDCVFAAYAGAMECIRNGVTSVFDHHACSSGAKGTVIGAASTLKKAGIRACIAYETSMRCGFDVCTGEIKENDEFISFCERDKSGLTAAMFGLHAPFTLGDQDIVCCVEANRGRTGFHIHVSEGLDDSYVCEHNYGVSPIMRLSRLGILGERTLLAHCVRVSNEELRIIGDSGSFVVNAPQSNMSNAVGTAPVFEMLGMGIPVCLGTDSFSHDMTESARAFILAQRSRLGLPWAGAAEAAKLLFENNAKLASAYFGRTIGVLKAGAAADVIILDHKPHTPINGDNAASQIIFGASGRDCVMTMAAGKVLMRDGKLTTLNEDELKRKISAASASLWERMKKDEGGDLQPTFLPCEAEK